MSDFSQTNGAELGGASEVSDAPLFDSVDAAARHAVELQAEADNSDAPPPAPVFAPDDLALLEGHNDAPVPLESAAKLLLELIGNTSGRCDGGSERFSFSSYSKTAVQVRAILRICRAALDFLEADYERCEADFLAFMREEIAGTEAARDGRADESGSRNEPDAVVRVTFDEVRAIAQQNGVRRVLREATLALLELAEQNAGQSEISCGFGDAACEGANELRACGDALGVCRSLLDLLDGDLIEAKEEQMAYYRKRLAAHKALDLEGGSR